MTAILERERGTKDLTFSRHALARRSYPLGKEMASQP
jgi:hypothetical protein